MDVLARFLLGTLVSEYFQEDRCFLASIQDLGATFSCVRSLLRIYGVRDIRRDEESLLAKLLWYYSFSKHLLPATSLSLGAYLIT